MTHTLDALMHTHNRNSREKPAVTAHESKLIRAALANVAGACKPKPEPNDFWHDLTRDDAELRNVHLDAYVIRCRQALEQARQQGIGTQAATVRRIEIFFATVCAIAVHGYECSPASDFGSAMVGLTKETADVTVAAAQVMNDPSERNVETLRVEIMEAIEFDGEVLDMASTRLAGSSCARQLATR